VALTFDQFLGIAGLIVGLVGIGLSVRSNQKMKTAEKAKRQVERKFMLYMASQEFNKLATDGIALVRVVRAGEWSATAELAGKISPALVQARGARTRLLSTIERDKLDVVVDDIHRIIALVPLSGGAQVSNEQIQSMIFQCQNAADLASELAGRLSVESMTDSEEQK
jgi:hypothetical protein